MKVKLNGPSEADTARVNRKSVDLAHTKSETAHAPNIPAQSKSDEIKVSDRGTVVQKLVERSANGPTIRQDKVDAVRARIDSGNFNPSAREIADKMINEGG